ncbi:MAG: hypothetical protein JWM27_1432 [Gemmatimonadetes bacterium]|nr:hypothetical protein [Gemmatimonadota bacterium]
MAGSATVGRGASVRGIRLDGVSPVEIGYESLAFETDATELVTDI